MNHFPSTTLQCFKAESLLDASEGGHPPVESLRRAGVAPAAAVSVEAADSLHHVSLGRHCLALPVVEDDVVHGDVAAGPGVAPDALNDDLEGGVRGDLGPAKVPGRSVANQEKILPQFEL